MNELEEALASFKSFASRMNDLATQLEAVGFEAVNVHVRTTDKRAREEAVMNYRRHCRDLAGTAERASELAAKINSAAAKFKTATALARAVKELAN